MNKNISFTVFIVLCIMLAGVFGKSYFDSYRLQALYEEENYTQIINSFSGSQNPVLLHNIGNTYFRLFESDQNGEDLEKSLIAFSGSLSREENEDTKYNYDFVKRLLEQVQQEQESNQEEEEKQSQDNQQQNGGENNTENSESSEEEQSSNDQDSQEGQQDSVQDSSQQQDSNQGENSNSKTTGGERGEQYSLDEEDEVGELSDEEISTLERQIESLKDQQIYNQRYYGKQNEASDFDSLYEAFFGEIDRGGEKTW